MVHYRVNRKHKRNSIPDKIIQNIIQHYYRQENVSWIRDPL